MLLPENINREIAQRRRVPLDFRLPASWIPPEMDLESSLAFQSVINYVER